MAGASFVTDIQSVTTPSLPEMAGKTSSNGLSVRYKFRNAKNIRLTDCMSVTQDQPALPYWTAREEALYVDEERGLRPPLFYLLLLTRFSPDKVYSPKHPTLKANDTQRRSFQ